MGCRHKNGKDSLMDFLTPRKKFRASLAFPGIEMRGDWGKPLATRLCPW